jgi:hypothetical protein
MAETTTRGGEMMDTNKLFESYLAQSSFTRELVFARLYGRMEKTTKYESDVFFNMLADLLEIVEDKKEGENDGE